ITNSRPGHDDPVTAPAEKPCERCEAMDLDYNYWGLEHPKELHAEIAALRTRVAERDALIRTVMGHRVNAQWFRDWHAEALKATADHAESYRTEPEEALLARIGKVRA